RTFRLVHYDYHLDGSLPAKPYPPRPEHCLSFYARDLETVEYQRSGMKAGNLSTVVFGQQTEVTHRYVGNHFLLIQVVFQPGALYRITGIPSNYLTNQYIDAETIFSKAIKTVTDRIKECHTYSKMIDVVESFLIQEVKRRACEIHCSDIATAALFLTKTLPPVNDLAKAACLTTRNLERHFQQRMGVSPKYFIKVMRFEQAFRMKNTHPDWDWLSVAIRCGYYDYQHLARDYRDLTGLTPNQFHEMDLHAPERIFGEADAY
ncbi:MAG: helix-turn-helix domain-containing protein, partial [Chitinophagaceae bacterium]